MKNKCYTDINKSLHNRMGGIHDVILTAGVVIITTLIGTLISAELSESAH